MHLPKLKIAHQLALLLSAFVVLAVLAVGGLSVWNLQRGFSDYLQARDEEQLTRLMGLVEQRASQDPSMAWLRGDREAMRELMDELQGRNGRGQRPLPPERARPPEGRPPPPDAPQDRGGPPEGGERPGPPGIGPPPPAPSAVAGNFPQRVTIRDLRGHRLAGREPPPGARLSTRAVKVDGVDVATIELVQEAQPEGVDARFLQRQYRGLAIAVAATIAAALLAAVWIGGRWSRPLRALQAATQRIAQGDFAAQVPVAGVPDAVHSGAVEIANLVGDVNAMAQSLAALESARRAWIAEISHELRTPLAVLRGELESIEDGARQPTPAVIGSLREEVMQLTRLVDDLHLLAVADMGQMPCDMTPGNAGDALLRMARRFETRAKQMGLVMDIRFDPQPIAAQWDYGRIEQLLSNLLENSLRYTDAPGRVRMTWRANATALSLTVEDSAPGVAPLHLPKLFEPLYRVDAARGRTGQHGSGLGLSIVQAIVRAHRGSVQARASDLGGLAIHVVLPLQPQRLERRKPL